MTAMMIRAYDDDTVRTQAGRATGYASISPFMRGWRRERTDGRAYAYVTTASRHARAYITSRRIRLTGVKYRTSRGFVRLASRWHAYNHHVTASRFKRASSRYDDG